MSMRNLLMTLVLVSGHFVWAGTLETLKAPGDFVTFRVQGKVLDDWTGRGTLWRWPGKGLVLTTRDEEDEKFRTYALNGELLTSTHARDMKYFVDTRIFENYYMARTVEGLYVVNFKTAEVKTYPQPCNEDFDVGITNFEDFVAFKTASEGVDVALICGNQLHVINLESGKTVFEDIQVEEYNGLLRLDLNGSHYFNIGNKEYFLLTIREDHDCVHPMPGDPSNCKVIEIVYNLTDRALATKKVDPLDVFLTDETKGWMDRTYDYKGRQLQFFYSWTQGLSVVDPLTSEVLYSAPSYNDDAAKTAIWIVGSGQNPEIAYYSNSWGLRHYNFLQPEVDQRFCDPPAPKDKYIGLELLFATGRFWYTVETPTSTSVFDLLSCRTLLSFNFDNQSVTWSGGFKGGLGYPQIGDDLTDDLGRIVQLGARPVPESKGQSDVFLRLMQ